MSIAETISKILEILGVSDDARREKMIQEVEGLIQARASQFTIESLPKAARKDLAKKDPRDVILSLKDQVDAKTIENFYDQATDEIIPQYLTDIIETATPQQAKQIQTLIKENVEQ